MSASSLTYVRLYCGLLSRRVDLHKSVLDRAAFPGSHAKYLSTTVFRKPVEVGTGSFIRRRFSPSFFSRALFGFIADYAMSWVAQNVIVTELRQAMFAAWWRYRSATFMTMPQGA